MKTSRGRQGKIRRESKIGNISVKLFLTLNHDRRKQCPDLTDPLFPELKDLKEQETEIEKNEAPATEPSAEDGQGLDG